MIGGHCCTNPPSSVSISTRARWDPTSSVWPSTSTKKREERKERDLRWKEEGEGLLFCAPDSNLDSFFGISVVCRLRLFALNVICVHMILFHLALFCECLF